MKFNLCEFFLQICSLCTNTNNTTVITPFVSVYYNSKVIIKFRQWKYVLKSIWEEILILKISSKKGLKEAKYGKNLNFIHHLVIIYFVNTYLIIIINIIIILTNNIYLIIILIINTAVLF